MTGLTLLFAAGKRPTRAALRDFAADSPAVSISFDPIDEASGIYLVDASDPNAQQPALGVEEGQGEDVWLELLCAGLSMDMIGIAPGRPSEIPLVENLFDIDERPTVSQYDAIRLAPGRHLTGGERSLPVIRGLIRLARDLVHHFEDLLAVVWPPSNSAIGRRFFESTATAWIDGGPFPALGLIAFKESMDGAIQSVGLEFWLGQELRIESPLSLDKVGATRIGMRLVNHLIAVGGLDEAERIMAPDGSRLIMRHSPNGKFIRVWRE